MENNALTCVVTYESDNALVIDESDNKPINDNIENDHNLTTTNVCTDINNDSKIPAKNNKNVGKKRGKIRKSADKGGERPQKARKLLKEEEGEVVDGNLEEINSGGKKSTNRYTDMQPKFSCEKCDKKFRRKNDLTTHIANVHLKVSFYIVSFLSSREI